MRKRDFLKAIAGTAVFGIGANRRAAARQQDRPSAIPVDLSVPFAPRPVTAEGRRHLLYELHVTNLGRTDLTLERVDVIHGSSILASYESDGLAAILTQLGPPPAEIRTVAGGRTLVAFVDVISPAASPLPATLRHRLTFRAVRPYDGPPQSIVDGRSIMIVNEPALILGPPVLGRHWLASHGLSNASSHRRTLVAVDGRARIAQRFAIDWTRIGDDGQVFRGDPAKNENWTPYGATVLAVANGQVVDLQDGIPENDPTADTKAVPITLHTVGGNYLILDVGRGKYVFYAHLQPGSLIVRRGERVRRGQALARLGNSGQSDAPHLHLHVIDAPSPLAAEGLPFAFDAFTLEGHVSTLRVLTDGTGWKPSEPASPRRVEMPVENAVVGFAGAAR